MAATVFFLMKYSVYPIFFLTRFMQSQAVVRATWVRSGLSLLAREARWHLDINEKGGRMMDAKQLKKILGSVGLAGLLATANLALPGCEKHPPAEQSS